MPAQWLDAAGNFQQFIFGGEIHQAFDEIKAHPAHAGFMQILQGLIADCTTHGGDATRFAIGCQTGIDHGAIIGAVTGRLHNDITGETQMIAQGK